MGTSLRRHFLYLKSAFFGEYSLGIKGKDFGEYLGNSGIKLKVLLGILQVK
jgi:hypothetical protein